MISSFQSYYLLLSMAASFSITAAAFFYIWKLDTPQIAFSALLGLLITWLIKKKFIRVQKKRTRHIPTLDLVTLSYYALIATYITVYSKIMIALSALQSFDAIRSPWEAVSSNLFVSYFLATFLLVTIILQVKNRKIIPLALISLHFFLTYSITFFIYGINYGFDPFIHQATEKILNTTGTITPKPLLYIGHYSLVVGLHKLTAVALPFIDRLLVPVATAVLIPTAIYHTLHRAFHVSSRSSLLTIIFFPALLLPFYFSVPQHFANVLLLTTVLLSVAYLKHKSPPLLLLWLLGIYTFLIHPFSGIPLITYLAFVTILTQQKVTISAKQKLLLLCLIILGGSIALPVALGIGNTIVAHMDLGTNAALLSSEIGTIAEWVPFYSIFHLVYLFDTNHLLILLLLAIAGKWLQVKKHGLKSPASYTLTAPMLFTFLIITINISLLKLINLPIIAYESSEFIDRFWQIALLFVTPLVLLPIATLIEKIMEKQPALKNITAQGTKKAIIPTPSQVHIFALMFFLSLFTTISFYLTYPRHDNFYKSRAYATSEYDIATVNWIEEDAAGSEYVVLANQAVSAAALHKLGFKKYFNFCPEESDQETRILCQQLFFYPIPTTSPLYSLYLEMVYQEPTKKRLETALALTGADKAYFVVNGYWLDAEKINITATESIGKPHIISNGKAAIFKLTQSP